MALGTVQMKRDAKVSPNFPTSSLIQNLFCFGKRKINCHNLVTNHRLPLHKSQSVEVKLPKCLNRSLLNLKLLKFSNSSAVGNVKTRLFHFRQLFRLSVSLCHECFFMRFTAARPSTCGYSCISRDALIMNIKRGSRNDNQTTR